MSRSTAIFVLAILSSTASIITQAQDAAKVPVPQSMGAFGDSISAGAFANLRRTDAVYPWIEGYVIGEMLGVLIRHDYKTIEHKGYSWSGGMDWRRPVNSH